MIPLGIFAKTFQRPSVLAVLEAVKETGFPATQFNMSCAGLDPLPDSVPAEIVEAVRAALAASSVEPAALSGTYNMIHPDKGFRNQKRAKIVKLIAAAPKMGFSLVTLCTGTRDADDPWRAHRDNDGGEAWADLIGELELILPAAENAGVTLGIEPETGNVVKTPAHARRLLAELGSKRLGVVIDPANLEEHPTRDSLRHRLSAAFEAVGDRIVLAHGKDRASDGRACAAGKGVVDFALFLHLLAGAGYGGPLILHGLAEEEAAGAAAHLRAAASSIGDARGSAH